MVNIQDALNKQTWAVVGATDKREKFGYKIFKHLCSRGKTVYPIHPRLKYLEQDLCYANLRDLPVKPDVVVFVVPESVGLKALEDCKAKGVEVVWLQPGADNIPVIEKAKSMGMQVITSCVLVELK